MERGYGCRLLIISMENNKEDVGIRMDVGFVIMSEECRCQSEQANKEPASFQIMGVGVSVVGISLSGWK